MCQQGILSFLDPGKEKEIEFDIWVKTLGIKTIKDINVKGSSIS